jgi:glycosyltransferase involved in cell wall biosynthesis
VNLAVLRVVTVTHYFPTHGGGIELVAARLVKEFTRLGVSIEWFASDADTAPQIESGGPTFRPVRSSNFVERLTQLPYPFWSLRDLPALWRAIGAASVVHVHEHIYFGSLIAILFAQIRRRPLVITQHAGQVRFSSHLLTHSFRFANRAMGGISLRLASRAVFISANVRRYFGLEKSPRAQLIFNGVDTSIFTPACEAERQRLRMALGIEGTRKVALYVGRFVHKKGFPVLKELTARFPGVQWLFAGAGPEAPSEWNRDNVRVLGILDHRQLANVYRVADMLVLPSFGEGMPLVVQEALACGTSVLSTREVRDACPEASALVCCPDVADNEAQAHHWERAMKDLLDDKLAANGREIRAQRARALWSWEACSESYVTLFRSVARGDVECGEIRT